MSAGLAAKEAPSCWATISVWLALAGLMLAAAAVLTTFIAGTTANEASFMRGLAFLAFWWCVLLSTSVVGCLAGATSLVRRERRWRRALAGLALNGVLVTLLMALRIYVGAHG